jgi:carboxyl-terminal processing protease
MINKNLKVWLPLIFSLIMIAGMYFGYQLHDQAGSEKGFFASDKRSTLQETLDLIKLKYVDSVRIDSLQQGAIEEMMAALDPHSVYFPPVELKEANEDLAGNFEGIGVEFNIFNDTVNVVYVIPEGPSDKAGLEIGDKILKVNDSVITNKDISSDEVKKLIRGERDSKVLLQVLRNDKQLDLVVKRGTIPVASVDAAYMINKTTGYIKLNKFSQSTYEEFMRSMERLQKEGLKELILDLRGNGGGFMNEAVDIADEFLDGDKLIVYTKGVNNPKRDYLCKRPGIFEKGPLAVLVDELSASASEVLTGALQDWDRATIVGRRTFGKGLVQEQYRLSDGSAIRLTVARYYTPLGRSIQRSYEKGKKVYMDEIWNRFSDGELLYADSNKITNGKQYKTRGGKIVYGGGGIMPDVFVPLDTSSYHRIVNTALLSGNFNSFVYNYFLKHKPLVEKYNTTADYIKGFSSQKDMWDQYVIFAAKEDSVNLSMISGAEKESLQKRLEAYLARFKWRNPGFYQVLNSNDTVIKIAEKELSK